MGKPPSPARTVRSRPRFSTMTPSPSTPPHAGCELMRSLRSLTTSDSPPGTPLKLVGRSPAAASRLSLASLFSSPSPHTNLVFFRIPAATIYILIISVPHCIDQRPPSSFLAGYILCPPPWSVSFKQLISLQQDSTVWRSTAPAATCWSSS